MNTLRSFWLLLALVFGLHSSVVWAVDTPPDVLARTTTQEVLAILKQDKEALSSNQSKVHELVEAKILPNFDFNRMTQLAVGKHWPRATAKQKQSLVAEFRNLLVRTYSSSLTAFSNQTVDFKPMVIKPDDTDVTVRSEIRQPGGQPIPINYNMYKTAFGWKVYDVAIDGVSLVTNYRASFSSTIRQNGIDGLISTLAAQSQSQAPRGAAKPAPRPGS
ncbi:MAG: ABC transporter substrate-binding protein [Thiobacillus sp.]|nr:ABC transporter substrate-binding protein [Gammaproteobacteria bacterium]MBU4500447.1 ABC transporter substrate-binding protein [Gammaproteobacteria bacterium]MDP1923262.1 ABC transporter substrate-binding protein [Thiobacillus sp.]MDP3126203.1 ABC transporter substrate-binding protein [Thiobacillus sp.]